MPPSCPWALVCNRVDVYGHYHFIIQAAHRKEVAKISERLARKQQQRCSKGLVRSTDGGALLEVLTQMLRKLDPPLVAASIVAAEAGAPAETDVLTVLPPRHAAVLMKLAQTVLALTRAAVLSAPGRLAGHVVLDHLVGRLGPACFGHALPTAPRPDRPSACCCVLNQRCI
jgi:hypothetical protein